jgi:hypothetical protein
MPQWLESAATGWACGSDARLPVDDPVAVGVHRARVHVAGQRRAELVAELLAAVAVAAASREHSGHAEVAERGDQARRSRP